MNTVLSTTEKETLKQKLWTSEQEVLDIIHGICIENNLKYSLAYGTLIGAVRHNGFIPWDDDIDIIMPRTDYEKLISIWANVSPKGYLIQNKRTDHDFTQNFSKIRKDNSTFIQYEFEKAVDYHTGIFVDIFPADRVAPSRFWRAIQYFACAFNLLFARGHSSGHSGIVSLVEKAALRLPISTQMRFYTKTEKIISKWQNCSKSEWFSPNTIAVCKRYFKSDLFENMTTVNFNGKSYCCVKDYDSFLKKIYGDYTELPPIEDRVWKHHPIEISFTHNYGDISRGDC